jgi:hypothetical protein
MGTIAPVDFDRLLASQLIWGNATSWASKGGQGGLTRKCSRKSSRLIEAVATEPDET